TSNDGGSWSVLGAGLPHLIVHSLKLHRPSRVLRAATFGRGMWDITVPFGGTSTPVLSINKTADAAVVAAGAPIGFTVQVSNSGATGTGVATAATLNDPLPPGAG